MEQVSTSQILASQWQQVRTAIRADIGEASFNSWIKPLQCDGLRGGRLHLSAPTRFMCDWVRSHFGDHLRAAWQGLDAEIDIVDIIVSRPLPRGKNAAPLAPPDSGQPEAAASQPASQPASRGASFGAIEQKSTGYAAQSVKPTSFGANFDGHDLGSPLDPRYRFDSFVVGKSNELAYAAAQRVAEQPDVKFNPLFIHGGVGLGKTHLMHAIAWHIREIDGARKVMYLSAEKFMYHFIRALRERDAMSFKQAFRSVDVLMIDDVQFFSRKDSTQEEFFHTFNALIDQKKQIVLTGDCSPSDLDDIEERVRSRLGWGLVADIHQTDFELRLGILESKLRQAGSTQIDRKVLEFLAHRINSNVRELEGALTRLLAYASLVGRPITLELSQEVLQDLLRANDRRITIEDIQKRVAAHYNIRMTDMHSARRARNVARPRQVAMYLSKQLTSRSLPEIGRKFGGRDHTTVMHAVRRIEELRQTEAVLAEDIEMLKRIIES